MLRAWELQSMFKETLHKIDKNFRSAKPEMQVIAGGIRCLMHMLNEFSHFVTSGDKKTVNMLYK